MHVLLRTIFQTAEVLRGPSRFPLTTTRHPGNACNVVALCGQTAGVKRNDITSSGAVFRLVNDKCDGPSVLPVPGIISNAVASKPVSSKLDGLTPSADISRHAGSRCAGPSILQGPKGTEEDSTVETTADVVDGTEDGGVGFPRACMVSGEIQFW